MVAWRLANASLNGPSKRKTARRRDQPAFEGPSADTILAEHGISFAADPIRYCVIETMIRAQAQGA